jgi:hypothetical protein
MSTGAVFKLIANEGKADKMILATQLLQQRLKDVTCAREKAGQKDTTPTLADIEKTHVLFINAHFKPFVTMAYEYNKVRPQSGTVRLGSTVTFSIPQFGDFFHDMVCYIRLGSFCWNATKTTPLQSGVYDYTDPTEFDFPYDRRMDAAEDPTTARAATDLPGFGSSGTEYYFNLVNANGTAMVNGRFASNTTTVNYYNLARYCEFPGNRLFKKVKFDVNGNPLDEYSDNVTVMLEKFCVPPNKRYGYNRLVGQENELRSVGSVRLSHASGPYFGYSTDADSANTPASIYPPDSVFLDNDAGEDTLTPQCLNVASTYEYSRVARHFVNGPQTPKPTQPALEIWNKLRFWFNDDVRLAIPSVAIPFGQRYITIELASGADLMFEYCNLYRETIADTVSCFACNAGLLFSTSRVKTYIPIMQATTTIDLNTSLTVDKMELYINNIFVNPEIHDIFLKRVGFSLIRVYREHTIFTNTSSSDDKLLSQLKWPIEYLFCGVRPSFNTDAVNNDKSYRDWHRLTRILDGTLNEPMISEISVRTNGPTTSTTGYDFPDINTTTTLYPAGDPKHMSTIYQIVPDTYPIPFPTISSLTMTSHGVVIYDGFGERFYNAYLPYHYGGLNLSTPEDIGGLFINFALFPRVYQPSGHLNFSRARETFIRWTSSYISAQTPANLVAVAVAINFLLIATGSAMLRYST